MAESFNQVISRLTEDIRLGRRTVNSLRGSLSGGDKSGTHPRWGGSDQHIAASNDRHQIQQLVLAIFRDAGVTDEQSYVLNRDRRALRDTPGQLDSFSHWKDVLQQYGLESLSPLITDWVRDDVPGAEIGMRLMDTPEFKQRFPAIELRRAKGLPAISPAEYISFERQTRQVFMQAGMPEGFYDSTEDFTNFLANDVSVAELARRVEDGFAAVAQAPVAVREAFNTYFGAQGDADLAAFFLDPEKALPVLEKQVAIGQVGGAAKQFGYDLDFGRASELADTGVGFAGARQGFEQINAIDPLFNETIGEVEDLSAAREGVDAVFGVGDRDARREIERRRGVRTAFNRAAGGAGAAAGQRGSGIGASDSR